MGRHAREHVGLTVWSFLMATAHGAGLMVVPVFMGMSMADAASTRTTCPPRARAPERRSSQPACMRVGYLVVTAFVAVLVFEKLGVGILRRAWFNLDLIWSAALVVTGALTLSL